MKDKISDKTLPDLVDSVQKVAEKQKEIENARKVAINTDTSHCFSKTNIDDAVNHVMKDASRINHIFANKMHNLDQLVSKLGSNENTIRAVLEALDKKVPFNGMVQDLVVNVAGYDIYVRGRVMNGILKIGTMFIK
jgi:hypothetical protein